MKILMVNTVCGTGSTGRICTDIAAQLEKAGHTCAIAYGRGNVPPAAQKYAIKIGFGFGVKLHAGLARIFDNSGFCSRFATKKLIRLIEKFKPDVIHLHNLHGYYLHVGRLFGYLKKAGIPVVWTLHDCWPFTGHAAYCEACGCDKWKAGCSRCPQKKKYPKSVFFERSSSNYAKKKKAFLGVKDLHIVTPSLWLKTLVNESFLGGYDTRVINNGIDTDVFKPTESRFKEAHVFGEKKMILGVANVWDERKGLKDLIGIANGAGGDYRLVLVGIADKQRGSLPGSALTIARTNSAEELAEIYSAADVLVNPTYEDNYPTVNLEAQACGTPVITYETGGSPESVPKENVVRKGDIAGVIALLGKDLEVNRQILSREEMVEQYIGLYESLPMTESKNG